MSIDYAALLASGPSLAVVKATYDFARDGGALYFRSIGSAVVPEGVLPIGVWSETLEAFTYGGTGQFFLQLNGITLIQPSDALGESKYAWLDFINSVRTAAPRALTGYINGAVILTGKANFYLIYLTG